MDTGNPASQPRLVLGLASCAHHDALGVIAGTVEAEGGQRIDGGLHGRDAPRRRLDNIQRSQLSLLEPHHRFNCRHLEKIVAHLMLALPMYATARSIVTTNGHDGHSRLERNARAFPRVELSAGAFLPPLPDYG
jgi:hypothetical protein